MSTTQWILNLVLLVWVLARNLGSRPVTLASLLVPLAVLLATGEWILRALPTGGHDVELELIGAGAGVLLGTIAAATIRTRRRDGNLVATAGAPFAAVWVAVIGGRMLFAQWVTHDGAQRIGEFSMRHQITGADAWTGAFVLMALMMVSVRVVATAVQMLVHRSTSTATPAAGMA